MPSRWARPSPCSWRRSVSAKRACRACRTYVRRLCSGGLCRDPPRLSHSERRGGPVRGAALAGPPSVRRRACQSTFCRGRISLLMTREAVFCPLRIQTKNLERYKTISEEMWPLVLWIKSMMLWVTLLSLGSTRGCFCSNGNPDCCSRPSTRMPSLLSRKTVMLFPSLEREGLYVPSLKAAISG